MASQPRAETVIEGQFLHGRPGTRAQSRKSLSISIFDYAPRDTRHQSDFLVLEPMAAL